jgi:FAD/FMN-containing dehydrogenase
MVLAMKRFILVLALLSWASSNPTKHKISLMDCTALSLALPGRVFFPGSDGYKQSIESYFAAFENEVSPTCVVFPNSAHDVSVTIKTAKVSGLLGEAPIAIRSGGHTAWAGAANVQNGITIDLSNLSAIGYDETTQVAFIGAGARWGNVYGFLEKKGRAVAGGRVSKVGVGGLTTGGECSAPDGYHVLR